MKTTINDRIRIISDKLCDGNISELARVTQVNQPALRDIVGTKQAKPRFEILNKIADNSTLNINGNWLLTGKGEMFKIPAPESEQASDIVINYLNNNYASVKNIVEITGASHREIEVWKSGKAKPSLATSLLIISHLLNMKKKFDLPTVAENSEPYNKLKNSEELIPIPFYYNIPPDKVRLSAEEIREQLKPDAVVYSSQPDGLALVPSPCQFINTDYFIHIGTTISLSSVCNWKTFLPNKLYLIAMKDHQKTIGHLFRDAATKELRCRSDKNDVFYINEEDISDIYLIYFWGNFS